MSVEVRHNADAERYEIFVDGQMAGLTEAQPLDGDVVLFPHTEIDSAFEGQGLASKLVAGALDDIRARGLRIEVTCPYILAWLPKHPEYADLLA
ncbi:MAG: GNAT family N-acetyltransferase [Aeromicrobium sp.]